MKKILFVGLMFLTLLNLVGCTTDSKIKIDTLDSELDYIEFRDRKIYLTSDLEQYILQFQGLKCKLNSNLDIDNITSKEHKFYQLKDNNFDITCPDPNIKYAADFGIMLKLKPSESNSLYKSNSVDGNIYYWSLSGGLDEELVVKFNGKKIIINGKKPSSKDDVIKIMGKDYEYEKSISIKGWYDLNYEISDIEYSFAFNDDDELKNVYVIKD